MPINLDAVKNFGAVDADTDPLLDQSFENHPAYISAKTHDRYVIIGRKGSGKTAVFRRLTENTSYDSIGFGHVFSEYPWHHHAKQVAIGVPEEQCYLSSWEYLINLTLAKILLNEDQSQPWSDESLRDSALLEKFVVDTYGSKNPDVAAVFLPNTKIRLSGEFGIDVKLLSTKVKSEGVPISELPVIVQEVNKTLLDAAIRCANPDIDYYICFDELDLGFSLQTNDYKNRLTGLLLAAKRINNKAIKAGKKVSVVIFLRDDIYQMLHFEDKNKLTQNAVSVIQWDNDKNGPSLKSLMEKRFHSVLSIEEEGSWSVVFDESQSMTSRQTKYNHIADRTFLRPRDIIRFSNAILDAHRANSPGTNAKFSNKDIADARGEYSEYLLDELDDEIAKHYPDYKLYLEVLKSIGSLQFTYEDLEAVVKERASMLPKGLQAREIAARLFEYSVIGYYRPGGAGFGGADYVWKYKERRAMMNENATSFRIHPGFMEVLGLKKFLRSD